MRRVCALAGNAPALIAGTGAPTTLNLQDPDSLTVIPGFGILIDSEADGHLVLFNPATGEADLLQLTSSMTVDDTACSGRSDPQTLRVADKKTNNIYAITGRFGNPGLFSAALDASGSGFVGALGPDGGYTSIVTGPGTPGGEQFPVPEPASLAAAGMGVLGLALLRRRRRV